MTVTEDFWVNCEEKHDLLIIETRLVSIISSSFFLEMIAVLIRTLRTNSEKQIYGHLGQIFASDESLISHIWEIMVCKDKFSV